MIKLKACREAAGLTQDELAEAAGTSQAQINRLETGKRPITLPWAKRLGAALGISWTSLMPEGELGFDPQTSAMLDLFQSMEPDQREAMVRLATTMAEPARNAGRHSDRKKTG